ncbi:hypothetical protein ISS86_00545 [Candidatus Microgenomates bacterium]|nr:hypothetical protein [Candidatus Microgenomates bacterium]
MNNKIDFQTLQRALSPVQRVLIIIPQGPSLDKIAASLSLYLSLKKTDKNVTIACVQQMTVEFSQLVGVDKMTNKIDRKSLIISFDYVKDSIEKVSYNVEGDKFNLVIQPKSGFPPLDTKSISYNYSGAEGELIFVVGAQRLEDLGDFYEREKNLYSENQVVNIDYHSQNTQFGKINIFNPQTSSYSEIIVSLLKNLNLPFDQDIATNLLIGLKSATNNFHSPNTSADIFESAAHCLRAGARQIGNLSADSPADNQEKKSLEEKKEQVPSSSDWLAPKIYKGKTRV